MTNIVGQSNLSRGNGNVVLPSSAVVNAARNRPSSTTLTEAAILFLQSVFYIALQLALFIAAPVNNGQSTLVLIDAAK